MTKYMAGVKASLAREEIQLWRRLDLAELFALDTLPRDVARAAVG